MDVENSDLRRELIDFLESYGAKDGPKMSVLCGAAYISLLKTSGLSRDEAKQRLSEFVDSIYGYKKK